MPADAVLPCGPRRSSPHPPAGSFLRSSPWQRSRCSPRGTDAAARNASYTRAPGDIDVDAAKHARDHAAGGSGCSSNAAGDRGTGWPANGLSAVPTGISISADAATGVRPTVPAAVPAGISAAVPAEAAAAVQPLGPADASTALPTVASKFSTANAADAEFSTTSSSNDVS